MKSLFVTLVMALSLSCGAQDICPSSMKVSFGKVIRNAVPGLKTLQGKTVTFSRIELGKKLCVYLGAGLQASLKITKSKSTFEMSQNPDSSKEYSYRLTESFPTKDLNDGRVELLTPNFDHVGWFEDEDGCEFRQTSCGSRQMAFASTTFEWIQLRVPKQLTP